MRQSTRLILNSLVTYGRMCVTVVLGLITTRLVLGKLGFVDFGLLILVGEASALVTIVTHALTQSVERHLAFEAAGDDQEKLLVTFNTTFGLFAALAMLATLLGAALGPLLLAVLDIPPGRFTATAWAYAGSVLGIALALLGTPFAAMLVANQELVWAAVVDVVEVVLGLVAAVALLWLPGDPLINYAAMLLGVRLVSRGVTVLLSVARFKASRPRPRYFRMSETIRIATFAGWFTLGQTAWQLRVQASGLLLNWAFGPVANAAWGVATRVVAYQASLANAIRAAASPAMVGMVARGDRGSLRDLTLWASKYSALSVLLFCVPVELEMDYLLRVWLAEVPPDTPTLARLLMAWVLVSSFSAGLPMAMQARGNIGWYTFWMSVPTNVLIIGLTGVWFFGVGGGAWALPATSLAIAVATTPFHVRYVGRQIGMPASEWWRRTVWPVAMPAAAGAAAAVALRLALPEGAARAILVTLAYAAVSLPTAYFLALEPRERERFTGVFHAGMARLAAWARRRGSAAE